MSFARIKIAPIVRILQRGNTSETSNTDSRIRGPPVILVGTFADKLPKSDVERKRAVTKYFQDLTTRIIEKNVNVAETHLVGKVLDIDNTKGPKTRNIELLKSLILETAKEQHYWGEVVPVKWIQLETVLVNLKAQGLKQLPKQRLIELNEQLLEPIEKAEEIEAFLNFYHDNGNIIYYGKHESLKNNIVLDPQWLVNAFRCLITNETFCRKNRFYKQWLEFNKTAVFSKELIHMIWEESEEFKGHTNLLLTLLEVLGIISKPSLEKDSLYLVPCVLKEPPPKEFLDRIDDKNRRTTSKLCFTTASRFLPTAIFNKLIAACIQNHRITPRGKDYHIYCGCGCFDVDSNHEMVVYFRDNVIQIWLSKTSTRGEKPDRKVCMEQRQFILTFLSQHIAAVKIFVKCSKGSADDDYKMFEMEELFKQTEVLCDCIPGRHAVPTEELTKYWFAHRKQRKMSAKNAEEGVLREDDLPGFAVENFESKDISKSNARSDNPVGYPLRKSVDDTMCERVVHLLREGMKSVGLLIDNGRPCGTVFRVGSKYLMTALHCLNNIKDLDDDKVCIDFNVSPFIPNRNVYHLTSRKVFNEKLDFVILEMSDPDEHIPEALELDKDIDDICSKMNSVSLIGYGHPDSSEKTLDPDCKLISAKNLQILKTEAEQWLLEKTSGYRTALKLKGDDPDLVNIGYQNLNLPGKFHVHCFMQQGASGAQAITTTLGPKCKVVGMLTHGLPEFYFYLPKAKQNGFKRNFLLEVASLMSAIHQCVMASEPKLAEDLFK